MGYYSSYIYLIPAIILTLWAQFKVNRAYNRFSQVMSSKHITGAQAAQYILRENGINIPIQQINGNLTDNYDPTSKVLNLSQGVYGSTSVAAIGIAAHECGHAIQDATNYSPLKLRKTFVPLANIGSRLSWPILIVGIIIGQMVSMDLGDMVFNVGVILFSFTVIFQLITLPVELNASRRALDSISRLGLVSDDEEYRGAKKVLSAAALTYVAALAMAVMNLLRILAMRNNRR